jgi:ABC-type Mn2+/Zn2+ transport system permease subunit
MAELWQAALDPFGYQFFVKGLAAAVLAGALCGLIGVFITLRGMSYIGHGLSHAIFGGYAAAPLLGVPIVLGAGLWGLASALAINAVTRSRRIGADAAIGVVTTASFALGVALLTRFGTKGPAFDSLLFGSINGVARSDLLLLGGALLLAAGVFTVLYRQFLFSTFDPQVANVSGVSVAAMDALLMLVLSLSILATLSIIGVTLVAATLVIPAVSARMLSDSFSRMLWISTLIGTCCGAVGMYASYHLEIPSGTTIVLTNAAVFLVVLAGTGSRGLRRSAGLDQHADTPAGPPVAAARVAPELSTR